MKFLLVSLAFLSFIGCSADITPLPDPREFTIEREGTTYAFRVDEWRKFVEAGEVSGYLVSFDQLCMPQVYTPEELDSILLARWYPWGVDMKEGEFAGQEGLTVRVWRTGEAEIDSLAFLRLAARELLHDFRVVPRDVCHGRRLTVAAYALAAIDRMVEVPFTGIDGIFGFHLSPLNLGDCSIGYIPVADLVSNPETYTIPLSRWLDTVPSDRIRWR